MMYKTAKLAKLTGSLPSEIWKLSQKGYDEDVCLDFDFAVADFWSLIESKREEQVQVREDGKNKLKKGHTWAPKYKSDGDILDLYYGETDTKPGSVSLSPELMRHKAELDDFIASWDG